MSWEPGARVGGYRLVRLLGRGGMGEVYLAFDERLQRQVAIKRVRPDRGDDAAFRARFRREARIVARLNHPAVVQVFDLLEDPLGDGGDVLVLEWVDGRSLAALIAEGPLDAHRLLALGENIARGLAAAHQQDLLHRDLKSANVLIGHDGSAKILDFGLARPLDPESEALTAEDAVLGTFATMSPEQARGERLEKSSDLFSLGVLLYEMARGVSPFKANQPYETLRRVQQEEVPPLQPLRPDLPPELCELIARLLAKEPAARPQDAGQVADQLRRIALGSSELRTSWREAAAAADATTWVPAPASQASRPPRSASATAATVAAESAPASRVPRRRFSLWAALALSVALVLGAWLGARFFRPAGMEPLLRVAVPPAQAGEAASPLLLASVVIEMQRGLLDLEGLVLFDSAQIGEVGGGPLAAARAVAADEVLTARLFSEQGRLLLVLQRIEAGEGRVLWAENLEMPAGAGGEADTLLAGSAIRAALRRAYAERQPRDGTLDIRVSPADYARFLEVRRRFEAGQRLSRPEDLTELEAIGASSPLFADAHVLAVSVALGLHRDSKNPLFLQQARRAVERALALGGDSPALLGAAVRLALVEGKDGEAGQLLERLARQRPGDPAIVDLTSRRLESQGRIDEAITLRRQALEQGVATWRELFFLADLEYRRGQHPEARGHLERALVQAPGNVWVLDKLGQIELAYGSLAAAERIFKELAAREPRRGYYTNLGLTYFLDRRYAAAIAAYTRAAELGGEHYALLLNQADAELARGRPEEARTLYGQAYSQLEAAEQRAALAPKEMTSKAQCLLHLGRREDAVALAIAALQKYPQEVEVQYHAALILASAGERASALACAKRALELGFPRRWLEIPAFASLAADPAFQALLAKPD